MDEPVPSYYSDVFDFVLSPYGLALTFGQAPARQSTARASVSTDQVTVRMSLEQAKVLAMLLTKNISTYEQTNGLEVGLPVAVYESLALSNADWPTTRASQP